MQYWYQSLRVFIRKQLDLVHLTKTKLWLGLGKSLLVPTTQSDLVFQRRPYIFFKKTACQLTTWRKSCVKLQYKLVNVTYNYTAALFYRGPFYRDIQNNALGPWLPPKFFLKKNAIFRHYKNKKYHTLPVTIPLFINTLLYPTNV